FKNVYKRYKGGHDVLKNINLTCVQGEITVFIGPSGCGKTTTMKLINRLINPTKGQILINGKDTSELNAVELRINIGYVIPNVGLYLHMNITINIADVL